METIADRVRALLERKGWSQSELSRRAGLTRSHVGWILNHPGSPVQTDTLDKLAAGAGVSSRWLTTGEGTPEEVGDDRTPSVSESTTPRLVNAIGFDDALAEAKRREPKIKAHAWEAVEGAKNYGLRGIVQPEDLVRLARVYEDLNDPDRLAQALVIQGEQLRQLKAERAAKAAEAPPPSDDGRKPPPRKSKAGK